VKLSKAERESVLKGNLEVRRPMRKGRSGRLHPTNIRIADLSVAGDKNFAVRSINRDDQASEWIIGLEEVGEWAARPRPARTGISFNQIEEMLPEVLTWETEPDIVVGDVIVFKYHEMHIDAKTIAWAARHRGEDGLTVPTETTRKVPAEYLTITHVGRHKRGHWFAKYVVGGADKVDFLAPKYGTTTDPLRSIDPDGPTVDVLVEPYQRRRVDGMRDRKRLVAAKQALLEQLVAAKGEGQMVRLRIAIGDLDRKIARVDRQHEREAA
jgi:hypothetical protein